MGYYVQTKSGPRGPFDADTLQKLLDANKLRATTPVTSEEGIRLSVEDAIAAERLAAEADLEGAIFEDDAPQEYAPEEYAVESATDEYAAEPPVEEPAPAPRRAPTRAPRRPPGSRKAV